MKAPIKIFLIFLLAARGNTSNQVPNSRNLPIPQATGPDAQLEFAESPILTALWLELQVQLQHLMDGDTVGLDYFLRLPISYRYCYNPEGIYKELCMKLPKFYDPNSEFSRTMASEGLQIHLSQEERVQLKNHKTAAYSTVLAYKRAAMWSINLLRNRMPLGYLSTTLLALRNDLQRFFTEHEIIYLLTPMPMISEKHLRKVDPTSVILWLRPRNVPGMESGDK